MLSSTRNILFAGTCIALLSGCTPSNTRVDVEQVFTNTQCRQPAGLTELRSQQSLLAVLAPQLSLPGPSDDVQPPEFDPASRYFLVSLGTKSSGGYSVRLGQSDAEIQDGTVWVDLAVQEPAPGMMTTQALTSPCLVFRVARANYTRLAVTGRDQWSLALEPTGN